MNRRLLVLVACIALACSDTPTIPGALATVRITPDQVDVGSLGELITLQAEGLDDAGTTIPGLEFTWSTSNPGIANVDGSGNVTTMGNGVVTISATTGGFTGTSQILVEQVPASLIFPDPPHALLVGQSFSTISVAVGDANGGRISDATGTITLEEAPGSPGQLVGGPRTAELSGGLARFSGVRPSGAGVGWRLRATGNGLVSNSGEFDVVTAFDRVVTSGSTPIGVLIDGLQGNAVLDDEGFVASGTAAEVGAVRPASGGNEVLLFGRNREPTLVSPVPWSLGVDTVPVTARSNIRPAITVWIVKGPFTQQRERAIDAVQTTDAIWSAQYAGLDFGSIEYVDATGDSDAESFFAIDGCGRRAEMEQQIGHRSGRLNIYYVERVDGGASRGRACPIGGDFAVLAESAGNELLSHEIGHLLSLTHIDHLSADFDRSNVMHSASSVRQYLTEAQIYRAHFNPNSAINQHLGLRPGRLQRSCAREQVSSTCPRIALRLWSDGMFPANGVSAAAQAPPASPSFTGGGGEGSDLVERFLDTTCGLEQNETLNGELSALGDRALDGLQSALEDPSSSRRLNAVHGIALLRTGAANAVLDQLAEGGDPVLAAEARAQRNRLNR